ncbi:MAG: ABC-2 transporter permease, partial [Acidobacteriota bacterium]
MTEATTSRRRQVWTLARKEIRRSLFSRRSLPVYLLVGMPLALMVLRALFMPSSMRADAIHATNEFAEVFHFFLLRFVVFFANALIFVRLFRGEILEKSLHYTLLSPVPRERLVRGKYLGGVLAACLILIPTTALTYLLVYLPHGSAGIRMLLSGAGISHLASYELIVVLASISYGALFMLAGLY